MVNTSIALLIKVVFNTRDSSDTTAKMLTRKLSKIIVKMGVGVSGDH